MCANLTLKLRANAPNTPPQMYIKCTAEISAPLVDSIAATAALATLATQPVATEVATVL